MTLQTIPYVNPYIAGNPVHGDFGFFGRADILRRVKQVLATAGQNAVILSVWAMMDWQDLNLDAVAISPINTILTRLILSQRREKDESC